MSETTALRICRDIANGSKHFVIRKPSVDRFFSIGREYQGQGRPERWFVVAGTEFLDVVDFAGQRAHAWDSFLANVPI
ncbi:MAG: hypothetical protein QOI24_2455 [Acidobacteriota bacterium]|jgi:hypothetical protein|nr:hypothetical protein [Acidobacteriota bacterium]